MVNPALVVRMCFLFFVKKNPEADPPTAPRASKKSNTNVSSRGEAGGRGHLFYFFKKIKKKWGISVALPITALTSFAQSHCYENPYVARDFCAWQAREPSHENGRCEDHDELRVSLSSGILRLGRTICV